MNCLNSDKRMRLPTLKIKVELLEKLKNNNVIIIISETGSGKSTQIPQYCVDYFSKEKKKIVCSQFDEFSTISVANRVSEVNKKLKIVKLL